MNKKLVASILLLAILSALFVFIPVYAQYQAGIQQQDRDQECEPEGPATRTYGESPAHNCTEERARNCTCIEEECEQYQYRYRYRHRHRHNQTES